MLTEAAFRELALAELDAVFRLACHLARNSQQAEDYVQETYLRAFRSSASFTLGEFGIRPWLFKILYNVIYSSGSKTRRESSAINELRHEPHHSEQSIQPADYSSLDWELVDQRLKSAILELPDHYRAVFLLSAVEGLKYQEIAGVVEAPIGTVMSRLSRARAILAERLKNLGPEFGFKARPSSVDAESEKPTT